MIDNNFAAPNNKLTFSINPKNRFVMAENSLQNQKNEVSFVLSEKAKAIIEKFEKQIEDRSENDKNELRIDLLLSVVKQCCPESFNFNAQELKDRDDIIEIVCFHSLVELNGQSNPEKNIFTQSLFSSLDIKLLSNELCQLFCYYCNIIPTRICLKEMGGRELWDLFSRLYIMDKNRKLTLPDISVFWNVGVFGSKENVFDFFKTIRYDEVLFMGDDKTIHPDGSAISYLDKEMPLESFLESYLKEDGVAFVVVEDNTINKDDGYDFRKWAVDKEFLHGVIEIPRLKVYGYRNQVLVLKKQQSDSIFFAKVNSFQIGEKLDVDKIVKVMTEKNPDYYRELSVEKFKTNNSNYYTFAKRQFAPSISANEGETIVRLGDLVDLYESEVEEDISCYFLNRPYYFINDYYGNIEAVEMPQARRVPNDKFFLFRWDEFAYEFSCAYQSVDYDGLLIDCDSSTGVGYPYDNYTHDPIICTYPNSIVFKLKEAPVEPIDPYYLAKLLYSSREVYAQLECYKLPFSDCILEKDDFLSILVAIPTMEEQQRILNMDRQKALAETREEIKKNFESYKQDIRMKKHAMAQRLTVMNNWWKNLLMAREEGNGIVDDDATVGHLHPVPVRNIYSQIGHEINMLFKQLNSFNLGDQWITRRFLMLLHLSKNMSNIMTQCLNISAHCLTNLPISVFQKKHFKSS